MSAEAEPKAGDTVRLRDGRIVEIESTGITSYTDWSGTYGGPFVGLGRDYDFEYVRLEDVEKIVATNPRLCRFCGDGVTSTNPEVDFCRMCFYSGTAKMAALQDAGHGGIIDRLAELPGAVMDSVSVWHTGGGCFALGVAFEETPRNRGAYALITVDAGVEVELVGEPVWIGGYYRDPDDEEPIDVLDAGWSGTATVAELIDALAAIRTTDKED